MRKGLPGYSEVTPDLLEGYAHMVSYHNFGISFDLNMSLPFPSLARSLTLVVPQFLHLKRGL